MSQTDGPVGTAVLHRQSAADQIAEILHQRILTGTLCSGEPLREVELATEFGVARNTVREALRLLTMENLATHAVHQGVRVRSFSIEEVREIYDLRRLLEAAVGTVAGTVDDTALEELTALVERGVAQRRSGDSRGWMTSNIEFHRGLVATLGNERLNRTFDGLMREVRLVLTTLEHSPQGEWDDLNRQLVSALVPRDGGQAFRTAIGAYMDASLSSVLDQLHERTA